MKNYTKFGALALAVLATASAAHAATYTATDGVASAVITATPNGPNTDVTIKLTNLNTAQALAAGGLERI
ncbi:MAG: hypothetical protein WCH60_21070, partial [Burkholderiales bacterium]